MAKRDHPATAWFVNGEDGRWEGRIVVGHKENGDSIFRYVYAILKLVDQWLEKKDGTIRPKTLARAQSGRG